MTPPIQPIYEIHGSYSIPSEYLINKGRELDYQHHLLDSWSNQEVDFDGATISIESLRSRYQYVIVEGDDWIYLVSHSNGSADFTAVGRTREAILVAHEDAKKRAPFYEEEQEDKVRVTFWSHTNQGPSSIARSLIVPTWEEINTNYTFLTRDHLSTYMNHNYRPGRGGQLMLWYGEPGTGKTTALRAMARSWKEWAEIHYITDPEKFFGDHADYMLQVMLDERDSDKWRLLVLEDCGELLAADARRLSGQGLSRFLNAVDGLIGQGLKFMILVTTNEELGKLHAAVSRPGRCAAQIEFGKLKDDEVVKWLTANKIESTISGTHTLADLFAITEEFDNQPVERKVGFA